MTFRFAPAAALAGLAWIGWGAFEASSQKVYGDAFNSTLDYLNIALFDAALILTAAAIMGIAASHGHSIGRLGRMSAPAMGASAAWLATFATLDAAYAHTAALEALATAGMVGFWISGTAFAAALLRAGILTKRWIGPALLLAIVTFPPLSEIGGSILLGAVLLALWAIARETGAATPARAAVTG